MREEIAEVTSFEVGAAAQQECRTDSGMLCAGTPKEKEKGCVPLTLHVQYHTLRTLGMHFVSLCAEMCIYCKTTFDQYESQSLYD